MFNCCCTCRNALVSPESRGLLHPKDFCLQNRCAPIKWYAGYGPIRSYLRTASHSLSPLNMLFKEKYMGQENWATGGRLSQNGELKEAAKNWTNVTSLFLLTLISDCDVMASNACDQSQRVPGSSTTYMTTRLCLKSDPSDCNEYWPYHVPELDQACRDYYADLPVDEGWKNSKCCSKYSRLDQILQRLSLRWSLLDSMKLPVFVSLNGSDL